RLLGFEQIGQIAHTCEHILGAVREGRREIDRALANDLMRGGDAILELVNATVEGRASTIDVKALTVPRGPGAPPAPKATPPPSRAPTEAPDPAPPPPPAAPPTPAPTATPPIAPAPPAIESAPAGAGARAARTVRQTIRVRVDRLDRL